LLAELDHFDMQIRRVTERLDQIGGSHPGVALLQSIPGVGPRTAEAVTAYIDDPGRFRRTRAIGSYFGLVPCQDQSARKNHLGRITRTGPATVRKLLVEAAWQSIRRCDEARTFFERVRRDDPDRRKIAVVATAHHLLRLMLAMLRSGELCRWNKLAA
jgi:transposase